MIFIILFVYSFAPLPGTGLITRVGSPLVRNDSCPNRGGAMLIAAYAPFSSRLLPLRDATQCLFTGISQMTRVWPCCGPCVSSE